MKHQHVLKSVNRNTRRVTKEISITVFLRSNDGNRFCSSQIEKRNISKINSRGKCLPSCQQRRGHPNRDYDQRSRSSPFENLRGSADLQIRLPPLSSWNLHFWYNCFNHLLAGIYRHIYGKGMEYHAVRIIGWGEENQVAYWIVANVWGRRWGMDGFFKILRGSNTAEIEAHVMAGIPAVPTHRA